MEVGIFGSIRAAILKTPATAMQFTLPGSKQDCVSVQPAGQVVEILSGAAWIACNGQDCELVAGQRYTLPNSGDTALISALGPSALIFRLHIAELECMSDVSSSVG